MKLVITIHEGTQARERLLELSHPPSSQDGTGLVAYRLDGKPGEADVAGIAPGLYSLLVSGQSYDVHLESRREHLATRGLVFSARVAGRLYHLEVEDPRRRRLKVPTGVAQGPQEIVAPMPGRVIKILVAPEQEVGAGESLLVIEAMKMQNELRAPRRGRVERVYVEEGAGVETGARLVRLV